MNINLASRPPSPSVLHSADDILRICVDGNIAAAKAGKPAHTRQRKKPRSIERGRS